MEIHNPINYFFIPSSTSTDPHFFTHFFTTPPNFSTFLTTTTAYAKANHNQISRPPPLNKLIYLQLNLFSPQIPHSPRPHHLHNQVLIPFLIYSQTPL